jgi:hypothetical protein
MQLYSVWHGHLPISVNWQSPSEIANIANKARIYHAQQHAMRNRIGFSEAVAHVRREMGLTPHAEI